MSEGKFSNWSLGLVNSILVGLLEGICKGIPDRVREGVSDTDSMPEGKFDS